MIELGLPKSRSERIKYIVEKESRAAFAILNKFWEEVSKDLGFKVSIPKLKFDSQYGSETYYAPRGKILNRKGYINIHSFQQYALGKTLENGVPPRYKLKNIIYSIMAHEYAHHIQSEIDLKKKVLLAGIPESMYYAIEEDQADYFAGVFMAYLEDKGHSNHNDSTHVRSLFNYMGSDRPKHTQVSGDDINPLNTIRSKDGHAEGVLRSTLVLTGYNNYKEQGMIEAVRFGLDDIWKDRIN